MAFPEEIQRNSPAFLFIFGISPRLESLASINVPDSCPRFQRRGERTPVPDPSAAGLALEPRQAPGKVPQGLSVRQRSGRRFQGDLVLYDGEAVLPIDRERNILAAPLAKLWGD